MRLYLSSFRIGDHPESLTALAGDDNRRTVVIANAMDDAPEDIRCAGVERERAALGKLGFDAAEKRSVTLSCAPTRPNRSGRA